MFCHTYRTLILSILLIAASLTSQYSNAALIKISKDSYRRRVVENVQVHERSRMRRTYTKDGGYEATTRCVPGDLLPAQYVCGLIRSPLDLDGKVVLMASWESRCNDQHPEEELLEIIEPLRSHPNYSRFAFILDYNKDFLGADEAREFIIKRGLINDCTLYLRLRHGTSYGWDNVSILDHLGRELWGDGVWNFQIGMPEQRQKVTEILRSLLDNLPAIDIPHTLLTEPLEAEYRFLEPMLVAGKNIEPLLNALHRIPEMRKLVVSLEEQMSAWRKRQCLRMHADYWDGHYYAVRERYERLKATFPSSNEKEIEGIEKLFASPFWKRMEALELRASKLLTLTEKEAIERRKEMREIAVWDCKLFPLRKSDPPLPLTNIPNIALEDSPTQVIEKFKDKSIPWAKPLPATMDVHVYRKLSEAHITEELLASNPQPTKEAIFNCSFGRTPKKIYEQFRLTHPGQDLLEMHKQGLEKICRLFAILLSKFKNQALPYQIKLEIDPVWKEHWEKTCAPILEPYNITDIKWEPIVYQIPSWSWVYLYNIEMSVGMLKKWITFNLTQPYNGGRAFPVYERFVKQLREMADLRLSWPEEPDVDRPAWKPEVKFENAQHYFPVLSFAPKRKNRWKIGIDLEAEANALKQIAVQNPENRLESMICAELILQYGHDEVAQWCKLLEEDPLEALYDYPKLVKTWPSVFAQHAPTINTLKQNPALKPAYQAQKKARGLFRRAASTNQSVKKKALHDIRKLTKQCEKAYAKEQDALTKTALSALIKRLKKATE